ncbi:30S ribosomal protein S2 [candidate division WWE3 bacterium]|nr:30S ribosomal protein S2 [candidate division WWE3 bacterium]
MATNTIPSLEEMLEAGVHFGHQTRRWHPRMKKFIFDAREGIHIINLEETYKRLEAAVELIEDRVKKGEQVLFIGTKKQAAPVVKRIAEESGINYIVNRWPGGLMTNFDNIHRAILRYEELVKVTENPEALKVFSTKDKFLMIKERERLGKVVEGLKGLTTPPTLLVIVDPKKESTAVSESRKAKATLVGIVDTNTDPHLVDYPIPANDDALKSIELILTAIANVIKSTRDTAAKKTAKKD